MAFKVCLTLCFIIAQWSLISAETYQLHGARAIEQHSCFTDESFTDLSITRVSGEILKLDFNSLNENSVITVEGNFELQAQDIGTVPHPKVHLNKYGHSGNLKFYEGELTQHAEEAGMHQDVSVSFTAYFRKISRDLELVYRVFAASTNATCCAGARSNLTRIVINV